MQLSTDELKKESMEPSTLAFAIQQIKMNGYVVLESVIPPDLISELGTFFNQILEHNVATKEANRGKNRYQMHLPFTEPFIHQQVVANPIALSVIDKFLGEDCICHYLGGNTPLPGSEYQILHSDIHQLFPDSDLVSPVYCIVLDIPLVDFRQDNGAMEIWPGGTHLVPNSTDIKKMSKVMYSEQVIMPAGSLLIRDARMWHRGTPNRSEAPRPNIALMYAHYWFKTMYPQIGIRQNIYDSLPERSKKLFRHEAIGTGEDPREMMVTRWT